jgi:sec-independent protein translocase protein TatA
MNPIPSSLAFIEGIGGPELLMIFFVILLLFGGQKLPELARGLGKSVREFKKATAGVEEEIKKAMEMPPEKPKPMLDIKPVVMPKNPFTDPPTDK